MDHSESWVDVRSAFGQAADWFVSTAVAGVDRCEVVALGEWTVRDLIGHTSRALLTVENYLGKEAVAVQVSSPVDYFRAALASVGDPAAVAGRGRDAALHWVQMLAPRSKRSPTGCSSESIWSSQTLWWPPRWGACV